MLDLKFGGPWLQFSFPFLPGGGPVLNSLAMHYEEPNGEPFTRELLTHFCSIRDTFAFAVLNQLYCPRMYE